MTCQKQAEGTLRAVVPFADGSAVRHRLNGAKGIVQTRTTEDPPRYFVLAEDEEGTFERIVRHHELEAFDTVAPERPSGALSLPKGTLMSLPFPLPGMAGNPFGSVYEFIRKPETFADLLKIETPMFSTPFGSPAHYPKPVDPRATVKNDTATGPQSIVWTKANCAAVREAYYGACNGNPRRFTVLRNPVAYDASKPWTGFDQSAGVISPNVATKREAEAWCEERMKAKAAPAPNVPQIVEWRTNDFGRLIGKVGGVDRFSVVKVPPVFGELCWSAQDGRELSPHFATQREAQDWCVMRTNPAATGTIYFSHEGPDGKHLSDCQRFTVQRHGEKYQAHDTRDQKYSPCYGALEDAFKWSLDRRRGRGTVNETTPKMEPAKLKNVPGLEWEEKPDQACWLWSKCRRFRVNMHPSAGTDRHWSQDMHHTGDGSRMSPNGTLSDAKEWCEDRAATSKPAEPVKAEVPAEKPAGKLVWNAIDRDGWIFDNTGRFKLNGITNGVFKVIGFDTFTTHSNANNLRTSPECESLDALKAWCEERNKFDVVTEAGVQRLEPKGTVVPF